MIGGMIGMRDNRKLWGLCGTIIVILLVALIVVSAVLIPRALTNGDASTGSAGGNGGSNVTVTSDGFPKDAAKSAVDYLVKLSDETVDALPDDFLTSDVDRLDKFGNGDTSALPESVKNQFVFSSDVSASGKTVSKDRFEACAYMALIMVATAYGEMHDVQGYSTTMGLVIVDKDLDRVYVPGAVLSGYPMSITLTLLWTKDGWRIDGNAAGTEVYAQLAQESAKASSTSDDSSSDDK